MDKKLNCVLEVSEKSFFKKESGENVNYVDLIAVIDGFRISLSVKQSSKDLFNYVLAKLDNE